MRRLPWNDDTSWSDDTSSIWQAMLDQTGFSVTKVRVILRDGSGVVSQLPKSLEEQPNGPFILENRGDMVLYVTYSSPSGSDEWEEYKGVVDKYWGALATYILADQIIRMEIRRARVASDE